MSFIKYQLPSILNQFGRKLVLHSDRYRVRGYIRNRLHTTLRHEEHLAGPFSRALAARSGLFMDVGVNTGQTLLRVLSIDPLRPYLGIEPQIACCFFISQFLRDNGLHHARIMPLALSDVDGVLELSSSGIDDEMASLVQHDRHATMRILVPVRTGDNLLHDIGGDAPAIIKIDVEGAEMRVLRGLQGTLARTRPILFFEVLPNFTGPDRTPIAEAEAASNRENAATLAALLQGLGYQLVQVDQMGKERTITRFDLDDRIGHAGRDYIAYPV